MDSPGQKIMAEFMKCLFESEQVLTHALKKGKTTEKPQVLRTWNSEVLVARKLKKRNWNRKGGFDFATKANNPVLPKQNFSLFEKSK